VDTAGDPGLGGMGGLHDDEGLNEQADFVAFDFDDEDENNVDLNDEDNYSS
jgi:hypothetical protein